MPGDPGELLAGERLGQLLHRRRQAGRIAEERRHVAEQDARLGVVGDGADEPPQLVARHDRTSLRLASRSIARD
jgi:hypothetical protein